MNRRTFLAATPALGLILNSTDGHAANAPEVSEKFQAVLKQIETDYGQMLSVAPAEGKFLHIQARLARAKTALEIGTSRGYGTLWVASALKQSGGHLTSMDILKERTEEAQESLEKAGLANVVTFRTGDAHKLVPELNKKFDFVLLDADKRGNLDYFQKLHPALLAPNAIILAHGAKQMEKEMTPFMEAVRAHKEFDSLTLNIVPEESFFLAFRK